MINYKVGDIVVIRADRYPSWAKPWENAICKVISIKDTLTEVELTNNIEVWWGIGYKTHGKATDFKLFQKRITVNHLPGWL